MVLTCCISLYKSLLAQKKKPANLVISSNTIVVLSSIKQHILPFNLTQTFLKHLMYRTYYPKKFTHMVNSVPIPTIKPIYNYAIIYNEVYKFGGLYR